MKERNLEEEEEIRRLFLSIMEGYSDPVIPSLKELSPSSIAEKSSSSRKREREKSMVTESLQKERERREKMSDMFSVLQTTVPNLVPKASREKIVTGTIHYVQFLEKERERLEKLKKSLPRASAPERPTLNRCNSTSSAVDVTVAGDGVVLFGIQLVYRRHLATEIFRVFEKHKAEVLAASVSMNCSGGDKQQLLAVTVTVVVDGGGGDKLEKIKREILKL